MRQGGREGRGEKGRERQKEREKKIASGAQLLWMSREYLKVTNSKTIIFKR